MTWRNQMFSARFAGVPIKYREVTETAGVRNVVHEFIGNRPPYVETMGRSTWRSTIDVYLIGENYLVTKSTLLNALRLPGPWEFIHPTHGPIMVKLERDAELRESVSEQGMVRIGQLALVEAGLDSPAIFDATSTRVASLAAAAADVMAKKTRFSLLGATNKVLQSISGAINRATASLAKQNARIGAVTGNMAAVSASLNNFSEQRNLLQQAPFQIVGGLIGIGMAAFNALGKYDLRKTITVEEPTWGAVEVAGATIRDLAAFETEPDDIDAGVPDGPQLAIAQTAHDEITLQMQTLAYVGGASIAAELPYASAAEASEMMALLKTGLAASAAAPGLAVEAAQALTVLRTTAIRHLLEIQAKLPRVTTVQVPATMPALVLAHELYGDADRASEIVARNRRLITRPGFVAEGTVLEVLADA